MIEQLKEKGAGFQSLIDGIDTTTITTATTTGGKLVLPIMGTLAEFERDQLKMTPKSS